jgi:hypothetical protein
MSADLATDFKEMRISVPSSSSSSSRTASALKNTEEKQMSSRNIFCSKDIQSAPTDPKNSFSNEDIQSAPTAAWEPKSSFPNEDIKHAHTRDSEPKDSFCNEHTQSAPTAEVSDPTTKLPVPSTTAKPNISTCSSEFFLTAGIRPYEQVLPLRQGATVCEFYTKAGWCRFGARCRFSHPPEIMDQHRPKAYNSLGYPLREDATPCIFFMQSHGWCKFGSTCKYDHPQSILNAAQGCMIFPPSSSTYQDYTPARFQVGICGHLYYTGTCPYADQCVFSHEVPSLEMPYALDGVLINPY